MAAPAMSGTWRWSRVRFEMTAVFSQREGLAFDDALAEARKITAGELVPQALQVWYDGSEEAFRDAVCAQAKKYLGTEYRWGGKSGRGIDCSGLVSSAYMQCGVLIYRDARIVEGWPMHQIPLQTKAGRCPLFPRPYRPLPRRGPLHPLHRRVRQRWRGHQQP